MKKTVRSGLIALVCTSLLMSYQNCTPQSPSSAANDSTNLVDTMPVVDPKGGVLLSRSDVVAQEKPALCDPFLAEPSGRQNPLADNSGISGKLYYLPDSTFTPSTVKEFLEKGIAVENPIRLSQINFSSIELTGGLRKKGSEKLRTHSGIMITDTFALDLRSEIQLGASDPEGYYQFALISDDGAILQLFDQPGSAQVINNDGSHLSKVECTRRPVLMTRKTRIPIHLVLHQGPNPSMSLMLKWRLVNQDVQEPLCGEVDENLQSAEEELLARSWKSLQPENFLSPTIKNQNLKASTCQL